MHCDGMHTARTGTPVHERIKWRENYVREPFDPSTISWRDWNDRSYFKHDKHTKCFTNCFTTISSSVVVGLNIYYKRGLCACVYESIKKSLYHQFDWFVTDTVRESLVKIVGFSWTKRCRQTGMVICNQLDHNLQFESYTLYITHDGSFFRTGPALIIIYDLLRWQALIYITKPRRSVMSTIYPTIQISSIHRYLFCDNFRSFFIILIKFTAIKKLNVVGDRDEGLV